MATKYRYHVGDRDIPGTRVSAMEVIAVGVNWRYYARLGGHTQL